MRFIPFIAFFLSGASSLIFQLIWSRLLHHVFGSSSVAISSVVSVFMGGLALGTWLFGKFADRLERPLMTYACAELGVALWGLVVPVLVRNDGWLSEVNEFLRGSLGAESTLFMAARFTCIVPILIIPTTLMGSTLPLLARYYVESTQNESRASSRVGALYAVNTFGAVVGVFLAGFVLMPNFGVARTNATAVTINFLLAVFILGLMRKPLAQKASVQTSSPLPSRSRDETEPATDVVSPRSRIVVAAVFAVSGAISLLYEVVWSRALINTIGASVYSFALILMTFLVGIASGSAIASSLIVANRKTPFLLAITSTLLAILACAPLAVRHTAIVWTAWAAVCIFAVLAVGLLALKRQRELSLLEGTTASEDQTIAWGLKTLAIPLTAALLVLLVDSHRLTQIGFSVVCSLCLFLYLIVVLRHSRILVLAAIQLFIGGATLVSDFWADQISLTFASMVAPLYDSLPDNVNVVMLLMSFTAALCVLPAALGMGAMFPLTMRIWSCGGRNIGRDVAVVYTGNTVGSIVGAWLPGFVLMPAFGMQNSLHIGIALNLLLALILLLITPLNTGDLSVDNRYKSETRSRPAFAARLPSGRWIAVHLLSALIPASIALLYVASTAADSLLKWNLTKMTLGTFRISLARSVLDQEAWGEPELVFYRDGVSTTVSVERWGRHYALKNNGKVDASNGDDMTTQIMVAGYPLLLHPTGGAGLDVVIVGFGSGVTVGAALQFAVRSIDVVELERSVIEGSRFFSADNNLKYSLQCYPYVKMRRLKIINDDGRNFLAATKKKYDVIVSEPSNPWLTGVSDLFTTDYFRITKRRLRPRGIYCQWVQLYEMSPENVKIIYRTFASHFKYVVAFSAEELASDTILLGSDSPLLFDLERFTRNLAPPAVRREVDRASIRTPFDLLARVLFASREEIMQYARVEHRLEAKRWKAYPASDNFRACPPSTCRREPVPLNTDDNALIEFSAPRDLIGFERYSGYLETVYAGDWPYGRLSERAVGFGSGDEAAENYANQAQALVSHGREPQAKAFIELSKRAGGNETSARTLKALALLIAPRGEPRFSFEEMVPRFSERARLNDQVAVGMKAVKEAFDRRDFKEALAQMEKLPISFRMQSGPFIRFLYGYLHYKNGNHPNVLGELEELLREDRDFATNHPELFYFLARSYNITRHFSKAVYNMRGYVEARELKPVEAANAMAR
ncbi:MAG: fused MFS/spermidine synthase [Deltaproteobacteria bacterium]|nr:fused MFS/spermidine synthase [Deltaproteobacteria bacterium]